MHRFTCGEKKIGKTSTSYYETSTSYHKTSYYEKDFTSRIGAKNKTKIKPKYESRKMVFKSELARLKIRMKNSRNILE